MCAVVDAFDSGDDDLRAVFVAEATIGREGVREECRDIETTGRLAMGVRFGFS